MKTKRQFIAVLILVVVGFGVGFYLQDLKHQESTTAAWKANRFNMEKFYEIRNFTRDMDEANWMLMRDSIVRELDSFMILRFRKELRLGGRKLNRLRFAVSSWPASRVESALPLGLKARCL